MENIVSYLLKHIKAPKNPYENYKVLFCLFYLIVFISFSDINCVTYSV